MVASLSKWWRKYKKEKKRKRLLALVRRVREQAGDYDNAVISVTRRSRQRPTRRGCVSHKGRRKGQNLPDGLHLPNAFHFIASRRRAKKIGVS
jgi:hypothetical protein